MPISTAALQRFFQILLLLVGAIFIGAVVTIAFARMGYSYELEWMEGGVLQTVQRIAAGQPVYVPPTVDFVPFIYTPLFFFLGAGLSKVLGDGFLPLRLLSFLASLGSLGLIYSMVKNRTQSAFWGFTGAAFFAACFEIGGGWFDLARVDALYLFFILLAVFVLEYRPDKPGNLLAGLVFILAFLTKQSALLVLFPIAAWTVFTGKGMLRWLMPAVAFGGIAVFVLMLNIFSHGWFNYYIFQLPSSHEIAWPLVIEFWRFDLLAPLPFALLAVFLLLLPVRSIIEQRKTWWLLTLAVAFIGSAFFSRLHAGGWNNVLLPAYAMMAVVLASTLGRLFKKAGPYFRILIYGVCLLQFSLLIFDPLDHLPTAVDQQAGDALMTRLQQAKGSVWMPHHGWMVGASGGKSSAHSMAMEDVLRGGDRKTAAILNTEIRSAIRRGRWQSIILDTPEFSEDLAGSYDLTETTIANDDAFWPVTGLKTRPELVYEIRQ